MLILFVVVVVVGGALWLKNANHLKLAKTLLIIASIPGVFALVFLAILVIGKPPMQLIY